MKKISSATVSGASSPDNQKPKTHNQNMNKRNITIAIAAIVVIGAALFFFMGKKENTNVGFETAKVQTATITTSVTATGTIEPVTSVTVGTQVSGIVSHLYVDYNSTVKKGQVIAELDRTNLMSELNSAKANFSSAQSEMQYQRGNYQRYQALYKKGLVSADEYESAKLSYDRAVESVKTAQQSVARAKTNLGYATITSPIDGVVLSKAVEEGQTVAASFNTPELFTIAQDLTNMQVVADVDEADIADVKEGAKVTFTVDAYPDDVFQGSVTQVRQSATTTNNVVTYEVVISAPNSDLKLKPGLTANVTITTNEKANVCAVPVKALRFNPNEIMLSPDEKIVNCDAKNKVWVKQGQTIRAIAVETGISDGTLTEIISGLKAGETVIIGNKSNGMPNDEESEEEKSTNPFMPGPPGKNKNKDAKKK